MDSSAPQVDLDCGECERVVFRIASALSDAAILQRFPSALQEDFAELAAALEGFIVNGYPIEMGLGLAGRPGRHHLSTRYARYRRDQWLAKAFELVGGATYAERLEKLVLEMRRFDERAWPRLRHLDDPPPRASALRCALFRARRAHPFPRTQKHVGNMMRGHISRPLD